MKEVEERNIVAEPKEQIKRDIFKLMFVEFLLYFNVIICLPVIAV